MSKWTPEYRKQYLKEYYQKKKEQLAQMGIQPRKRGRPRKNILIQQESNNTQPVSSNISSFPQEKRKRGRPPKKNINISLSDIKTASYYKVKNIKESISSDLPIRRLNRDKKLILTEMLSLYADKVGKPTNEPEKLCLYTDKAHILFRKGNIYLVNFYDSTENEFLVVLLNKGIVVPFDKKNHYQPTPEKKNHLAVKWEIFEEIEKAG